MHHRPRAQRHFFPYQVLGPRARVTRIKTKLKSNLFPVKGSVRVRVRGAAATRGSGELGRGAEQIFCVFIYRRFGRILKNASIVRRVSRIYCSTPMGRFDHVLFSMKDITFFSSCRTFYLSQSRWGRPIAACLGHGPFVSPYCSKCFSAFGPGMKCDTGIQMW